MAYVCCDFCINILTFVENYDIIFFGDVVLKLKNLVAGKTSNVFVQFFRYFFVGGFATVVHYFILIFLTEVFYVNANISNLVAFTVGLIVNYIISTIWVFDKRRVDNKWVEFIIFAIIGVVGLGINQFFIWLFDNPFREMAIFDGLFNGFITVDKYYIIGQVIATGVAFIWNFVARKVILYNKKEDKTDE